MSDRQTTLQNAAKLHDKLVRLRLPMTPKEAAGLLGVDTRTVVNWCITKRLGVRVGKVWVIDFQALVNSAAGNDSDDPPA